MNSSAQSRMIVDVLSTIFYVALSDVILEGRPSTRAPLVLELDQGP